jgi:hypothetical protein
MGNLISTDTTPNITAPITTSPVYIDQPLATSIIDKQNQIITNLQNAISDSRNILQIDAKIPNTTSTNTTPATTASVSHFDNVNQVSDYYTPPFYLANSNAPEISDYVNAYNTSIALLDYPKQINQVQFDTYIHLQNKKIAELQNAIASFPTNGNLNQPIKAIKNLQTSGSLNVEEYASNNPGNGSAKYPNYLIYGNNGCLQYNNNTHSNTPATWAFQSCNANDATQRFNMSKINTLTDYNGKIADPNNQSHKIQDTNSVIMGFYAVSPETDATQCLQLNNDGLSVMPCNMDSSQRFKPFYHSINP